MNHEMFTSKSDMYETPQYLFDKINDRFHFTLDACAVPENAKCETYFTPEIDGLSQKWTGTVWCNPPYGREVGKWVKKAAESAEKGATVVMLLASRTDTKWFQDYIYGKAEIYFIKGRLHFNGGGSAPFPSMIVIFRGKEGKGNANTEDNT